MQLVLYEHSTKDHVAWGEQAQWRQSTTNQKLLKTGCNNVFEATLFNVSNNIVRHCYTWLRGNSGSTICSILLTTNVAPTTLLHPVFSNLLQFFAMYTEGSPYVWQWFWGNGLLLKIPNKCTKKWPSPPENFKMGVMLGAERLCINL